MRRHSPKWHEIHMPRLLCPSSQLYHVLADQFTLLSKFLIHDWSYHIHFQYASCSPHLRMSLANKFHTIYEDKYIMDIKFHSPQVQIMKISTIYCNIGRLRTCRELSMVAFECQLFQISYGKLKEIAFITINSRYQYVQVHRGD